MIDLVIHRILDFSEGTEPIAVNHCVILSRLDAERHCG